MKAGPDSSGRVVVDVSSSLRWAGAPVGIVRVERELIRWMSNNVSGVAYVFFDPDRQIYRSLKERYARALLDGDAVLDTTGLSDPSRSRRRRMDRIPAAVKPLSLWVLRFPHMVLRSLERIRLSRDPGVLSSMIDSLQRAFMSAKQRQAIIGSNGSRRPYLPIDIACSDEFEFSSDDSLIAAGAGWLHANILAIRELKQRKQIRFVLFCHDIIPLLFPQFYRAHDVEAFRTYFETAVETCDLVIFSTHTGEQHARAFCLKHDLKMGSTAVGALGSDSLLRSDVQRALPDGLVAEKYILYVSTIEPRKGHQLLYEVWLRLLEAGIPQARGYKLVFVGRQGWGMETFFQNLLTDERVVGSLLILSDVDDDALAALYENAAFCVYPSIYEGYGLPVVEAFSYGKALISSNGGALAEVAGTFAPCLDPQDSEAWYQTIQAWMDDPRRHQAYELAIRERFTHPTWAIASERIFSLIKSARAH